MTEVTHTKGPWRVAAPPDKVCTDYGGGDDTTKNGWAKTIVICKRAPWMAQGEHFANAALISAAPEMLDALKGMIVAFGDFGSTDMDANELHFCRAACAFAEQAVAKAEGRP